MNKCWLPSHFSLLPCYLHRIWDHCLCNAKQTASHWIWIPMATFFNILLLFSCPAGVESVDDTIVLGKLDTGQYIGGKQLNSLQGKHHEHRHSKCNKCWQILYWHTDKLDDIIQKMYRMVLTEFKRKMHPWHQNVLCLPHVCSYFLPFETVYIST